MLLLLNVPWFCSLITMGDKFGMEHGNKINDQDTDWVETSNISIIPSPFMEKGCYKPSKRHAIT